MLQPGPLVPQKRPLPPGEPSAPVARTLQPRPSGRGPSNGDGNPLSQPSPGDTTGEPARKKRGRPSKAELNRRRAAAEARGEIYQPPKRRPPKKQDLPTETIGGGGGAASLDPPSSGGRDPETSTNAFVGLESGGSSGQGKRQKIGAEPQVLSRMQIPAVLSTEPAAAVGSSIAQEAILSEPPSTIAEPSSSDPVTLGSSSRAPGEHPSGLPLSNLEVQDPEPKSSGTLRRFSGTSGKTTQP